MAGAWAADTAAERTMSKIPGRVARISLFKSSSRLEI